MLVRAGNPLALTWSDGSESGWVDWRALGRLAVLIPMIEPSWRSALSGSAISPSSRSNRSWWAGAPSVPNRSLRRSAAGESRPASWRLEAPARDRGWPEIPASTPGSCLARGDPGGD
jgi:hypothetical protein